MEATNAPPAMNQRIFEMGLGTEPVSLYLLCCHLQDTGAIISKENMAGLWNGTESALMDAIDDLLEKQVLASILSSGEEIAVYRITDPEDWKA